MTYLSFAALIAHRVPLTAAEAVTLTLAVACLLDARRTTPREAQLPSDEHLLLSNTGQVTFKTVDGSTHQDETTALAALLRRLLQLDESDGVERRGRVPGGLLVLLARTLGQIDLDPPGREEFRTALSRFAGGADPSGAVLSTIFWRAASLRPATRRARTERALLPAAPETWTGVERRRHGPSRTELRRALRDLEREVFEGQPMLAPAALDRPRPRAAVAAGLIIAMLAAIVAGGGMIDATAGRAASIAAIPPSSRIPFSAVSGPRTVPILTRAHIGREAFSPAFGPRGRTLYFRAGRAAAPLMRAFVNDRGEIVRVTTVIDDGAANRHATLAPDGTMMAFDSDRDGMRGVYVADADGGRVRRISGGGYAAMPSWSPDGAYVAFVRGEQRRASVWNVWIARVADGSLARVTRHATGQPNGASWFPDGRRLVYSRDQQLVIVDLQSGRRTLIASPRPGRVVRTPAVSPDGSRVVFQVAHDGVWMLDVERMQLRRLLPDASAEAFAWSPDGRTIAYQAQREDGYGVWAMSI
jgi:Tol biopolymer transport system component